MGVTRKILLFTHNFFKEQSVPCCPVKSSNWAVACRMNISKPLTTAAPDSAASVKSLVLPGL